MAGPSTVTRRVFNQGGVSQTHRDVTDDRYRDLRKPRRVRFFCNGDRYFKGKRMFITPHRYLTFNDLLNDLTGKLPASVHLPYGVRQIYSPTGGSRIRDIEQLEDGANYVVAGFETFKSIRYGGNVIEPWSHGRPHNHDFYSDFGGSSTFSKAGHGAFQPARPLRPAAPTTTMRRPPGAGIGSRPWANRSDFNGPGGAAMKPRVITVVRHSHDRPRTNVKILLNRRTVQSYEQMMKDISEAFGPKWKTNKVKKLFTLKGKEVLGVNEFFRDDEVFIAVGNEPLQAPDMQDIIQEFYPDSALAKTAIKDFERRKQRRPMLSKTREYDDSKDDATTASKRDSGFGSDSSNRDEAERDDLYYDGRSRRQENQARLERERQRAAEAEREKARKKMQKRLEAEQRSLEEEKRRKGLMPLKPIQERDSFRKMQEERERERRKKEAEKRLREAEERARREEELRRRKPDEAKVIVVVKEDDRPKRKPKRTPRSKEDGYESDEDFLLTPRSGDTSMLDKVDSDEEHERKKREEEEAEVERKEKERLEREREERERLEKEERERKEREAKEREERERKEREEKEREEKERREREERERKEKEERERKEAEAKKKKSGHKSKLERQISNVSHVLDKYVPGRTLGDGNFAIVKQCQVRDEQGNSPDYAMKIIDKSKLKGKEHMIENEIEIMRLCKHPNIVKLVDEFETKDEIYLIMELVKGGDLFDAITQSVKFKEEVAARMVADLASSLFYLHSQHIVHRDLKPENLLVCRNRDGTITLKLADFGLAMEVTEPIYTVCGTPTYVAPEILSEIGYGLEVDMWAVGVISYILLCGFPPFRSPDRNQTELFEFIKAGEFEYLSPYWDNISREAKDLISRLLVVNKAKRYTAIDVLCHPWVISLAGTVQTPVKMEDHRRNLRRDLEIQGKANRESFLQNYKS